ncbi:MAG: hypothetical protein EOP09_18065, partial [Proteobacteria bacterium]
MSIRNVFILVLLLAPAITFGQVTRDQLQGFKNDWARAYVQSIDNSTQVTAISSFSEFRIGEILV